MNLKALKYLLFFTVLITITFSCKQVRYVPEGKYLYKVKTKSLPWHHNKKTIHFVTYENDSVPVYSASDDLVYLGDLYQILRPQPNMRLKLAFYNAIDSTKMNKQIDRKKRKTNAKNQKRKAREDRINKKRNDKALAKGKDFFVQKKVLKKRLKMGWRFWVVNKIGEPPVLQDSLLVSKSTEQLEIYLRKKGFYDCWVKDTIINNDKKRISQSRYTIFTGKPYYIGHIYFDTIPPGSKLASNYKRFVRKKGTDLHTGDLFDADKLDLERENFSKYLRDNGYFDLNKNYIYFIADTTKKDHIADVYIKVKPRIVQDPNDPEKIKELPHKSYKVKSVTYYIHNADSLSFNDFETYKKRLKDLGLEYSHDNYPLLDTMVFIDTMYFKDHKHGVRYACNLKGVVDTIVMNRGVFIYNEEMPIDYFLLERQNFLEPFVNGYKNNDNGWYKEYYVERSFRYMLGLDVFGSITPNVELDPENPNSRYVVVSYHLTPNKKQIFSTEPRATNSNGFLGVSASINYVNKNLFRGAEKFKFSLVGGLESQPIIFDQSVDEGSVLSQQRILNTYEINPKISLEFPKIVPLPPCVQVTLSKRLYPTTIIDAAYNFQKRQEFSRQITEVNYSWKFNEGKSKIHQINWQSFNFVKLDKTAFFEQKLDELNDPFLKNSYANHFSNKFKYTFTVNTQRVQLEKGKRNYILNVAKYTMSGLVLDLLNAGKNNIDPITNQKRIFGVPFTEFIALENDFRYYNKFKSDKSIALRFFTGVGYAFGNFPSLPYEESFFAGGSNDIRAWTARTMAPGGMQTWRDTTATTTQISDIKIEFNFEYRFQFSDVLKAAWFIDAGNIWKLKDDTTTTADDLGVFGFSTFINQVAIGGGFGLRIDFDFFLIRLDLAVPIYNPYMYAGERWIFTPKTQYDAELSNLPTTFVSTLSRPFMPRLNIGIGYAF